MSAEDDAAIAEYHQAARRRNVRIFAITALVCIAIGIAVIVVGLSAHEGAEESNSSITRARGSSGVVRTTVYGIAFVVAGIGAAWKAIKIRGGGQMG